MIYKKKKQFLILIITVILISTILLFFLHNESDENPVIINVREGVLVKDIFKFKWISEASHICANTNEPLISLTVVISAPDHIKHRNAIRQSWAKNKKKSSALIFLVGYSQELIDSLKHEAEQFQDLAVSSVTDIYDHLSLKTLTAFSWHQRFCPGAEFLVKVDDDVFLQIDRLHRLLKGVKNNPAMEMTRGKLILGNVASGWKPGRLKGHKYYVPEAVYNETFYPTFVTGPSYAVSKAAVPALLELAMESPYIHLEDVFITGVLAEKASIPRRYVNEFRNNAVEIPAKFMGCTLLRTITIHQVKPEEQRDLLEQSKNPKCGKNKNVI